MANRKQADHQTSRASRRGGVLRRSRRTDSESKRTPDARAGKDGNSSRDEDRNVSSLLETTSEDVKQLLEAADDASKKIREAARADAGEPGAGTSEASEASSLIGRINKEVQEVLESADEAAEKIREEAKGEARQLIEEARRKAENATTEHVDKVSEMTNQVLGELAAVQDRLERLQSAFDQATKAMSVELGVGDAEVWETQQNGAIEGEEESDALRSRLGRRTSRKSGAERPEGISEGARLLALQQLIAGVDAEVIEVRLKDEFGIEDPRPLLEWMGIHPESQPEKPQKSKKR